MIISAGELISELTELTEQHKFQAEILLQKDLEELNRRVNKASWSALECIEHLNLYGNFYISEIKKKIDSPSTPTEYFKSSFIANYFAQSMLPKEKLKKIKTFKDKDPLGMPLDKSTITTFIEQQILLLDLLQKAGKLNLNKIKIPLSIAQWIRFKLGDAFCVVIYHNKRHIAQAFKALYN